MNIAKDGRFVCYGPAGGGYGNPLERDPAKVADDVLDEVISVETALKDYGVVVSTKGVVDRVATEKARAPSQGRNASLKIGKVETAK
jgi:N-methylhydantoinase B